MRNHLGFIALSILAGTLAGCSTSESTTSSPTAQTGDLTGEFAKYNAALVPLTNACTVDSTKTKLTYTLESKEVLVLSLRSVDSALLANGKECTYADAKGVVGPMTSKVLKGIDVTGATGTELTSEVVIVDIRNGIFASGAITVDLKGVQTNPTTAAGDEIGVLGSTSADKMTCITATSTTPDYLDLNADKTADIKAKAYFKTDTTPSANNHFTIDLNSGDDTFDQSGCTTTMSVYGSAGKDTITVGSSAASIGDVFSGGTDGTATESQDAISFANRTAGVHVTLDTVADDGDGDGMTEKDKVLGDFEVVTGTKYADVLAAGNQGGNSVATEPTKATVYILNGGDGNDTLSSVKDYGAVFNGGLGFDTVDYSARTAGVTITMDGKLADDGEKSASGGPTGATLDNVGADIENIIGSDFGDKITGNSLNNTFKPGDGADVVIGGDGDDVMLSGLADGTDAVDGDDIFQGGLGNDLVDYSNRVSSGTQGVTVNLNCTFSAATVSGTRTTGVGALSGGSGESDAIGADVENAVGTIGDDVMHGNASPNSIWSLGGQDDITGLAGIDQLDANAYTATFQTANGYQCDGSLSCYDSTGTILNPQPANCDCKTPKGYRCIAGTTTPVCVDPATGLAYTSQPTGCDCAGVTGTTVIASDCNPATNVALDNTTISTVGVTCVAGTFDGGTCDTTNTTIDCGGDSMDMASCTGKSADFATCWKTQR